MKKVLSLLTAVLLMMLSAAGAPAGEISTEENQKEDIALSVDGWEVTDTELKDAIILHLLEAALRCAGYGYGYDITERLSIEDAADKVVFEIESYLVIRILAEKMGILPLNDAGRQAAAEDAEAVWAEYREIAWSDNGMAYLPAGDYVYAEGDPEGNLTRYFASFGLTTDVLLNRAMLDEADEQIKKEITGHMTDESDEDVLLYYCYWFMGQMDETEITENQEVIEQVIEELVSYYSGDGDDAGLNS